MGLDHSEEEATIETETPRPSNPLVSVVVPAYNEALILMESLTVIYEYLSLLEARYRWEVVVVNDGSTDETGPIAEVFASTHPGVRVLHHAVNLQLGRALRYAFNTCTGDYVVTLDCDLTYAPRHIELLLDGLRANHAKVAIASPYMKGGLTSKVPMARHILSRGANRFLSFTAAGRLSTLTGMVRAYDREFLSSLNLRSAGTDINTEILYKAQLLGATVIEVPAHLDWTSSRQLGSGRRSSVRLGRSVSAYAFSGFLFRPFAFFLVPGAVLLLLALVEVGWIGWDALSRLGSLNGPIDHRISMALNMTWQHSAQSYVIGGISLVLAVQLISLGILASQNKRYFEEVFHLGTTVYQAIGRNAQGAANPVQANPAPQEASTDPTYREPA